MVEPTGRYGVILVTAASRPEAETIAEALIQAKLAACVTLLPVYSIYTWQGAIHKDEEWQLLIKSELDRFPELETKIRELHSYDVPEIIAIPIVTGSSPYLQWISNTVNR
jgi:periplasmic divalent cation tolerance protein